MTMSTPETHDVEPVEEFRERARLWLKDNLPPDPDVVAAGEHDDALWLRARELQRLIHDGGFAGICFPSEYGGLGLTFEHQRAFTEESLPYEMPLVLNIPTFAICAATLLDTGSEEQKKRHLPKVLTGEEVWVQFLSEPKGGSDLAGVITRAERDGDEWVVNGSKIWSTGAYAADYALCLTRTNWDAPKHGGLTMFVMPTRAPGVTIQRIKHVNGGSEFCQVFFDDVRLPLDAVVGEVDGGWRTATRQLFHERNSVGGGSPYVSGRRTRPGASGADLVALARRTGQLEDPVVRDTIARSRVMSVVAEQLVRRVTGSIAAGVLPAPAGSIIRLFSAERAWTDYDAAMQIAGATGVAGAGPNDPALGQAGQNYLSRQGSSLGGGSTEMARNIISERVLQMPREHAPDLGVPYREVKQGQAT